MKIMYKGFELEAQREKCLAGYSLLYFTIYQNAYEHVSNFEDSEEKVRDKINELKEWVDNYIDCINRKECPECGSTLTRIRLRIWECGECEEMFEMPEEYIK